MLTVVTAASLPGCWAALIRRERDQGAALGGEVVTSSGSCDDPQD